MSYFNISIKKNVNLQLFVLLSSQTALGIICISLGLNELEMKLYFSVQAWVRGEQRWIWQPMWGWEESQAIAVTGTVPTSTFEYLSILFGH